MRIRATRFHGTPVIVPFPFGLTGVVRWHGENQTRAAGTSGRGEITVQGLRLFSRAVDRLSGWAGAIASILVLLACLISASNATIRYALNYSSNGWLEIQWYMFGALVFLGASHTLRMNEHVRVDLVFSSLSDRGQTWIDVIGFTFFFLPVTVYLTWLSFPFFWQSYRIGEMSNSAGGLILWPAKLLVPLGFALLTLQGISELIKRILILQGQMTMEVKYEKPLQ